MKKPRNNRSRIASRIVQKAIRKGIISKRPCEHCLKVNWKKLHAHHSDYTKPLDVIWLCSLHHRLIHKQIRWHKQYQSKINSWIYLFL